MATVTVSAEYAVHHCKARLENIRSEFEVDKEKWFSEQRIKQRKRGVWPFKYSYYPTETELQVHFEGKNGSDYDLYFYPEECLLRKHSHEKGVLRGIVTAAEVAERAGKADITLNSEEVSYLKRAVDIAA